MIWIVISVQHRLIKICLSLWGYYVSGIASLWGPAHGGANEAVVNMLEEIGSVDAIPEFIEKVKRKVLCL